LRPSRRARWLEDLKDFRAGDFSVVQAITKDGGVAVGKTIFIGGFGAGNLGDDLILASMLKRDPGATVVAYGKLFLSFPVDYIEFSDFISRPADFLASHELLVLGGGGILWSAEHIQELLIIGLTAKRLGMRIEISRIGLHGFHANEWSVRQLFALANRISVREPDSLDLAKVHLGLKGVILEEDYANEVILPVAPRKKERAKIGLNIANRGLIDDPGLSNHIAQICSQVASIFSGEADFFYIPFCVHMTAHNQSDIAKADLLFSASAGLIQFHHGIFNIDDLVNEAADFDIFFGERFHMHILARRLGRKFIPLIENEQTKYRALANQFRDPPVFYHLSLPNAVDQLRRQLRGAIDAYKSA